MSAASINCGARRVRHARKARSEVRDSKLPKPRIVDFAPSCFLVSSVPHDCFSESLWTIDEIARSRRQIGVDLLGMAGGDIFFQSFQESQNLHVRGHLAYP